MRKSDIQALRWANVTENEGYTRLIFRQQKTKGQEYLDISQMAVRYLGKRGEPTDKVFDGFYYSTQTSINLQRWMNAAGIDKKITFHCARHTNAVLLLEAGTDIYTVSKMLGHRDLKTTLIYTHILDKSKRDAVNKLESLFSKL